eukprot:Selendium_serpulae@DN6167_c1_g1_i2.p2
MGDRDAQRPIKGRGGMRENDPDDERKNRYQGSAGFFQRLDGQMADSDHDHGPARSIEGWIVIVTGVDEEAQEEDIHQPFGEFGAVKNLHFNLDRRTGYAKGYAFIEYEEYREAQKAIEQMDGKVILNHTVHVDWAFNKIPESARPRKRR